MRKGDSVTAFPYEDHRGQKAWMRETKLQNSGRLSNWPEDAQLGGGGADFEPSPLEPKLFFSSPRLLSQPHPFLLWATGAARSKTWGFNARKLGFKFLLCHVLAL